MKKLVYLMFPMMVFMASCGAQSTGDKDVTVAEAREMIKDNKVVIIDVRTPEEFEKGHLEGATMINFFGDDFDQQIAELPKDKEYLVYCHSGNRSGKAVKKMEEAGFTNAHNMTGGWSSWSAEVESKK
ncbi:rhodanese-like domain-containing protein [Owenweeksia hongkongensis]|uniref:rhodanese-like domain-containing protein n=1 Tax=Owenweeksia hongkongensis TaxID=253245 RepID=UPI003A932273